MQTGDDFSGIHYQKQSALLTEARKRTVTQIPVPETLEFLGTAGFCRLWILGFASLVAPLYPLTKGDAEFIWTEKH